VSDGLHGEDLRVEGEVIGDEVIHLETHYKCKVEADSERPETDSPDREARLRLNIKEVLAHA